MVMENVEGIPVEKSIIEHPKLLQPREHKAKVSLWADLTLNDVDILEEAITPEQIRSELAHIFSLEDHQENLKSAILLDLYFYTIQFSRDHSFSKEQTSAFFSIIKRTHEVCVETPFGNVDQCFSYFKEMVLCHAVKRPPYSIDLFTAEEVKHITDYVINTYFRHFKLYKYVFTPLVRLDLSMTYVGMPVTPPPVEIEEAEGETEEGGQSTEAEGVDATDHMAEGDAKEAPAEIDESPAARELRALLRKQLEEEVTSLKQSVDSQIRQSEDSISQKLAAVEGGGGKTARSSSKTKKK